MKGTPPAADEVFKQILLGGTLQDKLAGSNLVPSQLDWSATPTRAFVAPDQPGRQGALLPRPADRLVKFPKKSELLGRESDRHRGRILHYFANHELLAIETMAFTLLRFPEAPMEFKQGVFRILQEEQRHFKSYLERMNDFGVEMGEVPLSFYFWNSLKSMETPLDFVTRMSLTFEQANLDFALEYAQFFARELEDPVTAQLLKAVHDDEVTHVSHGWFWFNRWRSGGRSAWDDYRSRLPFPMSARRARGASEFFAGASRRLAGLSDDYIESVRITGGSRGRVPQLFFYNPQCEVEAIGTKLSAAMKEKIKDLEPILFWLAQEDDLVFAIEEPPKEWLKHVFDWRGELPEWLHSVNQTERPIESVRPWGWGRSAFQLQSEWSGAVKKRQALALDVFENELFSKVWWKQRLGTPGSIIRSQDDIAAVISSSPPQIHEWILKCEHSTSGRGHQRITRDSEPSNLKGLSWVMEPYFKKLHDFSVQYDLLPDGKVKSFEPRLFETDLRHQYLGSWLGKSHPLLESRRQQWVSEHKRVLQILREVGYLGPVGIDGLIAKSPDGIDEVVPIIEVNVRYTMGRLAHELERLLRKRGIAEGQLRLYTQLGEAKTWVEFAAELAKKYPDRCIQVTPPECARTTWMAVIC